MGEDSLYQRLKKAISDWDSIIQWIARGWDSIEEYTNDLTYRETVDEIIAEYEKTSELPESLVKMLADADNRFCEVTVESMLCVWHGGPAFRYYPDGDVELYFNEYDPKQYWYYFRWQPDCPYNFRCHDSISYQRAYYGMDFAAMTESQLKDAARKTVERLHKELEQLKRNKT